MHNRTVEYVWNYYKNSPEVATFVKIPEFSLNLVYCSVPERMQVPVWDVSIFFGSFDYWTWISLVLSILVISILSNDKRVTKTNIYYCRALTDLLSTGISLKIGIKALFLFICWIMISIVVANFYTADMTSHVISPSPDVKLTSVFDLERHNFSLLPAPGFAHLIVNPIIKALSGKDIVPPLIACIVRLMSRSRFHLTQTESKSLPDFIPKFLRLDKVAVVTLWPFSIQMTTAIKDFISSGEYASQKRCYVGEKLIPSVEMFVGFIPPGNAPLARAFLFSQASGIQRRWEQEFHGRLHSTRVQDRLKIKSPTNIVDENVRLYEALQLEGLTVTVFIIWGVGIFAALLGFLAEVIYITFSRKREATPITIYSYTFIR